MGLCVKKEQCIKNKLIWYHTKLERRYRLLKPVKWTMFKNCIHPIFVIFFFWTSAGNKSELVAIARIEHVYDTPPNTQPNRVQSCGEGGVKHIRIVYRWWRTVVFGRDVLDGFRDVSAAETWYPPAARETPAENGWPKAGSENTRWPRGWARRGKTRTDGPRTPREREMTGRNRTPPDTPLDWRAEKPRGADLAQTRTRPCDRGMSSR